MRNFTMKTKNIGGLGLLMIVVILMWIVVPIPNRGNSREAFRESDVCESGIFSADLTGWALEGETPRGKALYNASQRRLEVEVTNVKLNEGLVLDVRIGDDKIGQMEPLKGGSAKTSITVNESLTEDSRVRVFNDEVPILSANLRCEKLATPTPSPIPTATPSVTPSLSPTPTTTPSPSLAMS
jgi:hypothetical protein